MCENTYAWNGHVRVKILLCMISTSNHTWEYCVYQQAHEGKGLAIMVSTSNQVWESTSISAWDTYSFVTHNLVLYLTVSTLLTQPLHTGLLLFLRRRLLDCKASFLHEFHATRWLKPTSPVFILFWCIWRTPNMNICSHPVPMHSQYSELICLCSSCSDVMRWLRSVILLSSCFLNLIENSSGRKSHQTAFYFISK